VPGCKARGEVDAQVGGVFGCTAVKPNRVHRVVPCMRGVSLSGVQAIYYLSE